MEAKDLKQFNKELSWATRIYTLLAVAVMTFAFMTDAWNSDWVITMLLGIAVILFVETFAISFQRHPKLWKTLRWVLIFILIAILTISMASGFFR